jgi:hypothetical protein
LSAANTINASGPAAATCCRSAAFPKRVSLDSLLLAHGAYESGDRRSKPRVELADSDRGLPEDVMKHAGGDHVVPRTAQIEQPAHLGRVLD